MEKIILITGGTGEIGKATALELSRTDSRVVISARDVASGEATSDEFRAESQNIVMCALRKKLLSPALVPAIPELVQTFLQNVQTDLSPEQINQLACLANQMSGSDVIFASFPIELFENRKIFDPQLNATTSILDVDFNVLRDYIARFQHGTWPDPDLVIDATPSPAEPDREFACGD